MLIWPLRWKKILRYSCPPRGSSHKSQLRLLEYFVVFTNVSWLFRTLYCCVFIAKTVHQRENRHFDLCWGLQSSDLQARAHQNWWELSQAIYEANRKNTYTLILPKKERTARNRHHTENLPFRTVRDLENFFLYCDLSTAPKLMQLLDDFSLFSH